MLINSKIKHPKMLLLWCLVALFSLGTASGWFWFQDRIRQNGFAHKLHETQIENDAFVEHTEQVIRNVEITLSAVREFYLQTGSITKTEQFIQHLSLDKSLAVGINLIDSNGYAVFSQNPALKGVKVQDRDYFFFHKNSQLDQLHISSVELGRITSQYLFRVTRRINNPDGSFGGIVLVTLRPQAFSDYYRRLNDDVEGLTSLVGIDDRKIRARTPNPSNTAWQIPVDSNLWDFLSKSPTGHYRSKGALDHIEREFIYRQVGELPLVLVTAFSDRDVEQNVSRQMLPITIASIAAVVFSVMLATILTIVFRQREDMHKLATVDVLTGLSSRRHFMALAEHELARTTRYGGEMSVLMVDIDNFKAINDTYGHHVGDRVLQTLGEVFRSILREVDFVGRIGGEEFAVVFPQTGIMQAFEVAERLRRSVEQAEVTREAGLPLHVTVSIGMASRGVANTNIDTLLSRADKALYEAKSQGRNQLCIFEIGQHSGADEN